MGCGASTEKNAPAAKQRYPMQKRPEEPELNGKAKFLSCPVVGDVQHPETKDRWFVLAFAPQSYYGLIISARNVTNGVSMVVKDVTDQQLAKEKEDQLITMSWNLFFKAVASEITKINKGGAKADFLPNGSLSLEIKIAIAGAAAQARKTDIYKCVLEQAENTPANIYKYFVDPIAFYYCRKKTDLVDRPDPMREKTLGELEAATVVRSAGISAARREISNLTPILEPLRRESEKLCAETDAQVAKAVLTRHVVLEKTAMPSITTMDAFQGPLTGHVDPESAFLRGPDKEISSTLLEMREHVPLRPGSVTAATPLLEHLVGCEQSLESIPKLVEVAKKDTASCAAYLYLRYVDIASLNVEYTTLCKFLSSIDSLYASQTRALWGSNRAITAIGLALYVLGRMEGPSLGYIAANEKEWMAFVTAVYCMDVDHPGRCNELLRCRKSFLSTLYSRKSPAQRHAVAVSLQKARDAGIVLEPSVFVHLSNLVVCTDLQLIPSVEEIVQQRSREIVDFSRQQADRTLAGGMLLRAIDVAIIQSNMALSKPWNALQKEEDAAEKAYATSVGVLFFKQDNTCTPRETFSTVRLVFPKLKEAKVFE